MRICDWCEPRQVYFNEKPPERIHIKGDHILEIDNGGRFHYFHPKCHTAFKAAGCFDCERKGGELALVPVRSMYLIIHMQLVCRKCYDRISDGTPWEKLPKFTRESPPGEDELYAKPEHPADLDALCACQHAACMLHQMGPASAKDLADTYSTPRGPLKEQLETLVKAGLATKKGEVFGISPHYSDKKLCRYFRTN